MNSVAITLTGLERSLLSAPVHSSFQRHAPSPADLFIVIVGKWAEGKDAHNDAHQEGSASLRTRVNAAYHPLHLDFMDEQPLRLRCAPWNSRRGRKTIREETELQPCEQATMWGEANRVLLQWIGLRRAYELVERYESLHRKQYAWLVRTRSDLVFLQPFPRLEGLSRAHAYVPAGGMNRAPSAMCTNDHVFVCPRHLCRAYYHLLEIFESPLCRGPLLRPGGNLSFGWANCESTAHTMPSHHDFEGLLSESIFAIQNKDDDHRLLMNPSPMIPYNLPAVPPLVWQSAEWYFLARYAPSSTQCVASKFVTHECCGLIRELPFAYTIAKGTAARGRLVCQYTLHDAHRDPRKVSAEAWRMCAELNMQYRSGNESVEAGRTSRAGGNGHGRVWRPQPPRTIQISSEAHPPFKLQGKKSA